jgi:hypothetical protein
MDFAVSFPARGVIHLKSRSLFGDADHPDCRRFLECVFRAEEVSHVEIRDSTAELRYCPETHQLTDVIQRVASYLHGQVKGSDGANGGQGQPGRQVAVGDGSAGGGPLFPP